MYFFFNFPVTYELLDMWCFLWWLKNGMGNVNSSVEEKLYFVLFCVFFSSLSRRRFFFHSFIQLFVNNIFFFSFFLWVSCFFFLLAFRLFIIPYEQRIKNEIHKKKLEMLERKKKLFPYEDLKFPNQNEGKTYNIKQVWY